jgi:MoaA/NifB/PqqE/SkfB family radical SAM enzyme
MTRPIKCFYTLSGINYKNGFVTSCPQQSDQLYVIGKNSSVKPSDIINSDGFKKHRLEMMSGQWSPGCHLCKEVEEATAGKSMRDDAPASDLHYNPSSGEIDFKSIEHIELRFSNACNFACLHCSDVYSSGWMSKLKYYQADDEDKKHNLIQLTRTMHRASKDDTLSIDLDLNNMTEIVSDLNKNFPNIQKIDFAGGEVLYQKQFFPCLELLASHPNKDNITVSFHSNFNAKADMTKLYNLVSVFGGMINPNTGNRQRGASIMLSIDAGENIYPYFRTGNWQVLKDNLKTFKDLDINKQTSLTIVCTTSSYQIMDLENIFESFFDLGVDMISSSIVYTPRYINPALMMLEHKESVLADIAKVKQLIVKKKNERLADISNSAKLRSWKPSTKHFTDLKTAESAIENIEKYVLNNKLITQEEYDALNVFIRKTDSIWHQNFNDFFVKYKYEDNKIVRKE